MNATATDLQIRIDTIRRRIQAGREAAAAGDSVDLGALGEEIREVSGALRAAPLQIDREAVAQDLASIIADLDRLQAELTELHAARGGTVEADDGAGA